MADGQPAPGPDISRLRSLPGLSDEGVKIGKQQQSVRCWYEELRAQGLFKDALQVLPHLMTREQAVWWGCLALWHYQRETTRPADPLHAALKAAIAWLRQPGEATRRQAEQLGKRLGKGTSPGALAMAVAWSGGSMAPADLPAVPPPPELTAKMVAACVILAVVKREPRRLSAAYQQMLSLGEEVLQGQSSHSEHPAEPG